MLILDDDFEYVITILVGNKGLFNEESDIFKLRLQSFAEESEKIDPVLHKQYQMDFIIMGWEKRKVCRVKLIQQRRIVKTIQNKRVPAVIATHFLAHSL